MKYAEIKQVIEQLNKLASEDLTDNRALLVAEEMGDDKVLEIVASALVKSLAPLNKAIKKLDKLAEAESGNVDTQALEELAILAEEFDNSGDEILIRNAAVLDQLLVNFGKEDVEKLKTADDNEVERLRAKLRHDTSEKLYSESRKEQKKDYQAEETAKAVNNTVKAYRPMEAGLNTRTCPDHPGSSVIRIADAVYQCSLDHKVYNWSEGFTSDKGAKIPGSSVEEQTRNLNDRAIEHSEFSTREQKFGR